MSPIPLLISIGILAIVLGGLFWIAKELTEFEHAFFYAAGFVVILLIGTAVYLAYAVPSLAEHPFTPSPQQSSVTVDQSNLLQE